MLYETHVRSSGNGLKVLKSHVVILLASVSDIAVDVVDTGNQDQIPLPEQAWRA